MDATPEVGPELIRHVARLARLRLTEAEVAALAPQLARILGHVEQVRTLALEPAEAAGPAAEGPVAVWDDLRADVPGPTLAPGDLLRNAPAHDGAFLVVPRFFDEDLG